MQWKELLKYIKNINEFSILYVPFSYRTIILRPRANESFMEIKDKDKKIDVSEGTANKKAEDKGNNQTEVECYSKNYKIL